MTRKPKRLPCPRNWPPVANRHRLWKLRNTLQFGRTIPPYKSPWLPGMRKAIRKRDIYTDEMREDQREYYE